VRLTVITPLAIIVEAGDVVHLRAEDETGAFGILSGHADFLTALAVSVVSWRDGHGVEHHVAVRGGILEVCGGKTIAVATPEGELIELVGGAEAQRIKQVLGGVRGATR